VPAPRASLRYAEPRALSSIDFDHRGRMRDVSGTRDGRRRLTPVSKTPFSFDKWLILNASGLHEPSAYLRDAGTHISADSTVPPAAQRSPTGDVGLPSEWLFSMAVEPVLIVDATTQRILQANPAAAELVRISQRLLIGAPFKGVFDASSLQAITHSIDSACATGQSEAVALRTAADSTELGVRLSLFRAEAERYLLVRLVAGVGPAFERPSGPAQTPAFDAIEGASVGFLVTDSGFRVEYANQAFLEMVGLPALDQVRGKSLARWLALSDTDLARLRDQMSQRQASSIMTAGLRSEHNLLREVEVCAVAVPDGQLPCWGFTLRELPRLN
jgi:PAS domain-containing protein